MGIAAGVGAHRPAPRPLRCLRARTRRPTLPPGDRPLRLLFDPASAVAVLHRDTRRETVNPSGLRPAFHGEAGSLTGGTASDRGLCAPAGSAIPIAPLQCPAISSSAAR